jgi:hypothetical protein
VKSGFGEHGRYPVKGMRLTNGVGRINEGGTAK